MGLTDCLTTRKYQPWMSGSKFLTKKKLYFDCATPNHRTAECFSKTTYQNCHKHHTSMRDHEQTNSGKRTLVTASENNKGTLPVITVKVNGITCHALTDTGAGSSYASAKRLDLLTKKLCETKTKHVDMLISSQVTKLEVYDSIKILRWKFSDVCEIDKSQQRRAIID